MSGRRALFVLATVGALAGAWWYRSTVLGPKPAAARPVVVFIPSGSTPFWQLAINGARDAAKKYEVELKIEKPERSENLEEQIQMLSALEYDKITGVALSPANPERETRLINTVAQKTFVVTLDADAPLSMRHCHIGTSNVDAGRLCAELVQEAVPDGGEVAVLLANLSKSTNVDRRNEFGESLSAIKSADGSDKPKYQLLDPLVDEGDDARCRELIKKTLTDHPNIACFVALNARQGPLLLDVLKAEGKLGKIKLITFDEAEATLKGVEDGHIFATVAQDPYMYGYESVHKLASLARGDSSDLPIVGGGTLHVNAEAIRKDNLETFRKRLHERLPAAEKVAKN